MLLLHVFPAEYRTFLVLALLMNFVTIPSDNSDITHNTANDQNAIWIIRYGWYCGKT
jgi:hypothetical protein